MIFDPILTLLHSSVPGLLLADEGLKSSDSIQSKGGKSGAEHLVKNFLMIHESCSEKDAAPRRYMTFLKTYKELYNDKKDGVVKRQQHLQVLSISVFTYVPKDTFQRAVLLLLPILAHINH